MGRSGPKDEGMAAIKDLEEAAQALGAALHASPEVQEYLQAREAVLHDAALRELAEEMERVYRGLVSRQRNGELLFPEEVNAFYALRERYSRHPLVVRYEKCRAAVKALCEQAGSTISSILSVDYTDLVQNI